MSKVDWSLAPKDATHYNEINEMFYKLVGNEYFFYEVDNETLCRGGDKSRYFHDFIERPKQPQAWSGPEDGLPPVGTICELRKKTSGWGEAEIKYQGKRGICVWLWVRRDGNSEQVEWAESPDKLEFRAILTPAQLRESAIRELMDIAQVDCRVTAARLVDAGFKRGVV